MNDLYNPEHHKNKLNEVYILEHSRNDQESDPQEDLITISFKIFKPIDAEIEKHRMISSNGSSDRAIPFHKTIEREPYFPPDVRKNEKGMQGYENLDQESLEQFYKDLEEIHEHIKEKLHKWNGFVHKQHLNRYLMPFILQDKLLTANRKWWDYFLHLRVRHDVDTNMQIVAKNIQQKLESSEPTTQTYHLPFLSKDEKMSNDFSLFEKVLMSIARCARISYNNHYGNKPSLEEDIRLAKMLLQRPYSDSKGVEMDASDPIHGTPSEHQAIAMRNSYVESLSEGMTFVVDDSNVHSGNFTSWLQVRKIIESFNNDFNSLEKYFD